MASGYGQQALELGRWIADTWDWQAFFTVTVKDDPLRADSLAGGSAPVGVARAEAMLDRWLVGSVAQRGAGAYWWAAMESHQWRRTPHFHGLVGGMDGDPRRSAMWQEWRISDRLAGRAQIVPIADPVGVATYVAKYVNKGLGKIYTSRSLDLWKRRA